MDPYFDYDKDDDLDIVGDGLFGDINGNKIYWKNESGKFKELLQINIKLFF